jgi:hypothetical protein
MLKVLYVDMRCTWLDPQDGEPTEYEITKILVTNPHGYVLSQDGYNQVRLAAPDDFDLVVIGNNRGLGFSIVDALRLSMRSRAIIIWNRLDESGEQSRYRALGVTHFTERRTLREFIPQIVGSLPA